ncbi:MAG: DUF4180 domain-containing protein [Eubacteriales bacterium]|nr:DUF4180 domain-containing protein [Eubacteriales bacterium]
MRTIVENGVAVAVVETDGKQLAMTDAASALDLAMTAKYECGASRIVIPQSAVARDFFVLSTGLAGEILQKYVNYQFKIAIYGDFTRYTSKPLHDFMVESNRGKDVFFVSTEEEAVARLAKA